MSFTSFDSSSGGTFPSLSLTGLTTNTWNTVTFSQLSNGTTGAVLLLVNDSSHNPTVGWRQSGQTGYTFTAGQGAATQTFAVVGLDATQHFDFYLSSTAGLTVYLVASFGSEYVPINPVALTALTTAYANYNVSANCPNGTVAVLDIGAVSNVGVRQNGSSDTISNSSEGNVHRSYFVGLDANQIFQAKGQSAVQPTLVGYFTAGITWHQNAVSVTPGTAGSFQNLTPAGGDASPIGFIFDNTGTLSTYTYALCEQGSGFSTTSKCPANWHSQAVAANPAQINMSTIANTLWELAYFVTPAAPPTLPLFGAIVN